MINVSVVQEHNDLFRFESSINHYRDISKYGCQKLIVRLIEETLLVFEVLIDLSLECLLTHFIRNQPASHLVAYHPQSLHVLVGELLSAPLIRHFNASNHVSAELQWHYHEISCD